MLDQNTDRMWFVIGAVIVGAAIIFIANGTLPTLFASVTDTFKDASDGAAVSIEENIPPIVDLKEEIASMKPSATRYLEPGDMSASRSTVLAYDSATRTHTLKLIHFTKWSSGFRIKNAANIVVPYGSVFKLEYDVLAPIGMYAQNDINNSTILADGSLVYVNDGDDSGNRIGQFRTGDFQYEEMYAPANEWKTITMLYRNKNNMERNPERVPLLDSTSFGVHVTEEDAPTTVQLRNIRVTIYDPVEEGD